MMTKEEYIQSLEKLNNVSDNFSDDHTIEKYPYFLMGRFLLSQKNKSADKTVLALMYPDRSRLASLLNTKKTKQVKPQKTESKSENKQIDDPLAILQQRLQDITATAKGENNEYLEDVPLFEPEPSISLDELVEKFNNQPPTITPIWDNFDNEHLYRDLGKNSSMERMNIISETLAEIYISQNLYDKAIKIYQELLLKYPEKNAIFANLIEKLKNR